MSLIVRELPNSRMVHEFPILGRTTQNPDQALLSFQTAGVKFEPLGCNLELKIMFEG